MGFLLVVLYVLASGGQMLLNKVYQSRVKTTALSYSLYLFCISASAAIAFFLMAGGNVSGNAVSYLMSFITCVIVILNLMMPLLCMDHTNLAVMTVSQNAGSLVLPALFGVIFLNEIVSLSRILGILLMIAAFLVSFLEDMKKKDAKKSSRMGYAVCIALFFTTGINQIIHKLYTVSSATASNAAYLFWLNVFMLPLVILALLIIQKRAGKPLREMISAIPCRNYGWVVLGSVLGCVGMIFSMRAMGMMDIAVYSPVYSSLYMLFMTAVSRFVFREKLTGHNYCSVVLAIAAAVLSVL